MKTFNLILGFLFLLCLSCQSQMDNIDLDDDLIASNLFKQGSNDKKLLTGEWELAKFAYTKDGNQIVDLADPSFVKYYGHNYYCRLSVFDFENEIDVPVWRIKILSEYRCAYSITLPNFINLTVNQISYDLRISPEQDSLVLALNNTYSFIIKGKELILHFTEIDKKNLLIFKKIEL